MYQLDVRGLSCPEPVMRTQETMKKHKDAIEVLVDSIAARDNIVHLAEQNNRKVTITTQGADFRLVLK